MAEQQISVQELIDRLTKIYFLNKKYFIKAEEILEGMSFFVAPVIEHRDALDHVMRFFRDGKEKGYDVYIDELKNAVSHEVRAFFDIADYICVKVRYIINEDLKRLSKRQIKSIWVDYEKIKREMHQLSLFIAEVRRNRSGLPEKIEEYSSMLDKAIDMYNSYMENIQAKIKARKFS